MEIDSQNDKLQGKMLCGLVDSSPYVVDVLVGKGNYASNGHRCHSRGTDTSNTQNVIRPVTKNVIGLGPDFDGVDDNEMNELDDLDVAHNVVETTRSAPVNQNDDFASDLDRLFTVDVPPVNPNDEIVTRSQLI